MNKRMESIYNIMPLRIKEGLYRIDNVLIEEIRIKANAPVFVYSKNQEFYLFYNNEVIYTSIDDIAEILKRATKNSVYAYLEDIKNGYITIDNGHRIGICGRAVYENDKLINIKEISSLNIRCANELTGVGQKIFENIFDGSDLKNTLIISPPKCGKTTVLRDITRLMSGVKNMRIVLIDERDEIAASFMGASTVDVGDRTFVLSGYLKKEGFSHAVRSLSPTVVICDEIGDDKDVSLIQSVLVRGVKIVASIHGSSVEEVLNKNKFNCFERIIVLNKNFQSKIYSLKNGEYYEL